MSDGEDTEFHFIGDYTVNKNGDRIYTQFEEIVHGSDRPIRYVVKTGDVVRLLSTGPLDYVALVTEMGETRGKHKGKTTVDQWMRVRWFYRTEDIERLPKGTSVRECLLLGSICRDASGCLSCRLFPQEGV